MINLDNIDFFLRRRHSRVRSPEEFLTFIIAIAAAGIFLKVAEKYAPDMDPKLQKIIAVVIMFAVLIICTFIFGDKQA